MNLMLMRGVIAMVCFANLVAITPALADPPSVIECENHSHVYDKKDCPENASSNNWTKFPGSGGGGQGNGGLLGLVHSLTGGLL